MKSGRADPAASADKILEIARAALRSEARVHYDPAAIRLGFADGVVTVEGEAVNVAAKKLALERLAAIADVAWVVDRLRVRPSVRMADGDIRDRVRDALLAESALARSAVREWVKGEPQVARRPPGGSGIIDIKVDDGVVTLDGDVPGLAHKRLAGVLAWWVPGTRDVVNGLGVTPPEADNDEEIMDAVRTALEKDPFVNPDQIRVGVRNAVVMLAGVVPAESERDMAEFDAWYVFGVNDVINRIEVRA
jgi:osmotically-inducible protein OsmY